MLEGEAGIGKSTLWLAGVEHARERDSAYSRRAPPRRSTGSRMRASAISSRASPTKSCPRSPRRGGARSKSRSCGRTRATMPSIRVRSASRRATRCSVSPRVSPSSSRSTTCSGSTPRRRSALAFALRRLGAGRCAPAARRRRVGAGSPPSRLEQALGPERVRRLRGRSAERRRAPSPAARSSRQAVRTPDPAPDPRAVGRESVLRAGAGRGRADGTVQGARDARGASPRAGSPGSRVHTRRTRAGVRVRDDAREAAPRRAGVAAERSCRRSRRT